MLNARKLSYVMWLASNNTNRLKLDFEESSSNKPINPRGQSNYITLRVQRINH